MIMPLPDTIKTAWGDAAVHDFVTWIEVVMGDQITVRPEWSDFSDRMTQFSGQMTAFESRSTSVESRLTDVEGRLTGVETRLTAVEARLTDVEVRLRMVEHDIAELKTELREFRRAMDERFDRLQEQLVQQTRWSLGFIAAFGTVFAILLGIVQLRP